MSVKFSNSSTTPSCNSGLNCYSSFEWLLFTMSVCCAITSIVGNFLIMKVIYAKTKSSVTFLLIACQASSDLLFGVMSLVHWITCSDFLITNYSFGNACDFTWTLKVSSFFVSVFVMLTISLNRFLKLYYPTSQLEINAHYAKPLIWLASLVLAAFYVINSRLSITFTDYNLKGCRVAFRNDFAMFNSKFAFMRLSLVLFIGNFIPLLITGFLYFKIIVKVNERTAINMGINDSRAMVIATRKRNTVKMLITVYVAYLITTLPINVLGFIGKLMTANSSTMVACTPWSRAPLWIRFLNFWLQLSTVINFFIMIKFNDDFRASVKKIMFRQGGQADIQEPSGSAFTTKESTQTNTNV